MHNHLEAFFENSSAIVEEVQAVISGKEDIATSVEFPEYPFSLANAKASDIIHRVCSNVEEKGHEIDVIVESRADCDHGACKYNTSKNQWADFANSATEAQGQGVVDFIAYVKGISRTESMKQIAPLVGFIWRNKNEIKSKDKTTIKSPSVEKITKVSNQVSNHISMKYEDIEFDKISHYKHGTPSFIYPYNNSEGNVEFLQCRFDLDGGKKAFSPVTFYKEENDKVKYTFKGISQKRPLYQLTDLLLFKEKPVLLLEGEKCVDEAKKLVGEDFVCTTWSNGCKASRKTDFSPLAGKAVWLWPDNDTNGIEAMRKLGDLLFQEYKCKVKVVEIPDCFDKSDDIANALERGMTAQEVRTHIFKSSSTVDTFYNLAPFRPLGICRNVIAFQRQDGEIYEFKVDNIKMLNLVLLAEKQFFLENYFNPGTSKFDIADLVSMLINDCRKKGYYNSNTVRGIGIWKDEDDIILNTGKVLYIYKFNSDLSFNRVEVKKIGMHDGPNIYTSTGEPVDTKPVIPLDSSTANTIFSFLYDYIRFRNPNQALLALGWMVTAFIPGLLDWRAHIYVSGAIGTGKTTLAGDIIEKVLSPFILPLSSSTTAAGIRQLTGDRSVSIIMDEAEAEDKYGAEKMAKILELSRDASTAKNFKIVKGTSGGSAKEYATNFCICLLSVGQPLVRPADISRFAALDLVNIDQYSSTIDTSDFAEKLEVLFSEKNCHAFRERVIRLIPILIANIKNFRKAISKVTNSPRHGDVHGTLHAGCYTFLKGKLASDEEIATWINDNDIASLICTSNQASDEDRCLRHILEHHVKIKYHTLPNEHTIGELIKAHAHRLASEIEDELYGISGIEADQQLRRLGIKVALDSDNNINVIIINDSSHISKILRDTPWSKNWGEILKRINGAKSKSSTTFSPGIKGRATQIPVDYFCTDYRDVDTAVDTPSHLYKQMTEEINTQQEQ